MTSIDGLKSLINFDVQNYSEVKNRRKMFKHYQIGRNPSVSQGVTDKRYQTWI